MAVGRASILTTAPGSRTGAFGAFEWALFLGLGIGWGASFLLIDIGLDSFAPAVVTMLRLGFGALTMVFVPAARRPVDRQDWPPIIVIAVLWLAVPFSLFPIAQQWIDSAVSGMLNGAMPIWAALITFLLIRTPPGRAQSVGLLIGFCGVVAIGVPSLGGSDTAALGVVLVVVATICYAISANISAPLQQRYGTLPVAARAMWVAALLVTPLGIWNLPGSDPAAGPIAAVVVLGVVSTGLGFPALAELVGRVGATRGSMITYVIPVVALALGVVVLDESVSGVAVGGSALVIVGALLASRRER